MAHFAVIEEGVVTNTIIADSLEIAKKATGKVCVEHEFVAGGVQIGWTYDGTEFAQPVYEVSDVPVITDAPKK